MTKNTVRVIVRVKPKSEPDKDELITIFKNQQNPSIFIRKTKDDSLYQFKFHQVISETSQQQLYQDNCQETVESVLQGYSSTIMAYGQTGSGKTYTMTGPDQMSQDMECQGIIQRAIKQIFAKSKNNQGNVQLRVTYIEIHNDQIRDLLNTEKKASGDIQINEQRGIINIKNVNCQHVKTAKEALYYLYEGIKSRSTASHEMNTRSSRSHAIYTIWAQKTQQDGTVLNGKINLVDLAGSERQYKTLAEGQTAREASQINKSLTFLEQVVVALAKKQQHVPYRSSKLTYFLKDSIGGNCKTLLIGCIWGESTQVNESISTCRFAQRMMQVTENASQNFGEKESSNGLVGVHGSLVKLDPMVQRILEQMTNDAVQRERQRLQKKYNQTENEVAEDVALREKQDEKCQVRKGNAGNEEQSLGRKNNLGNSKVLAQKNGRESNEKDELIRLRQRVKDLELIQNQNQLNESASASFVRTPSNSGLRKGQQPQSEVTRRSKQMQRLEVEVPKLRLDPQQKSPDDRSSSIQVDIIQNSSSGASTQQGQISNSQMGVLQAKVQQLEKERNLQALEMQSKIDEMQRQKQMDKQFCEDLKLQIDGMKERMKRLQLQSVDNQIDEKELMVLKTQIGVLQDKYLAQQKVCTHDQNELDNKTKILQDFQLKQDLQNIIAKLDRDSYCKGGSRAPSQGSPIELGGGPPSQQNNPLTQEQSGEIQKKNIKISGQKNSIGQKGDIQSSILKNGDIQENNKVYDMDQNNRDQQIVVQGNVDQSFQERLAELEEQYGSLKQDKFEVQQNVQQNVQQKMERSLGVLEERGNLTDMELLNLQSGQKNNLVNLMQPLNIDEGISEVMEKLKLIEEAGGEQYASEVLQIKHKILEVQETYIDEQQFQPQDLSSRLEQTSQSKIQKSTSIDILPFQTLDLEALKPQINHSNRDLPHNVEPKNDSASPKKSPKSDISGPKTPLSNFKNLYELDQQSSRSPIESSENQFKPSDNSSPIIGLENKYGTGHHTTIRESVQQTRQDGQAPPESKLLEGVDKIEGIQEILTRQKYLLKEKENAKRGQRIPKLDLRAPNLVDLDLNYNEAWIQQILNSSCTKSSANITPSTLASQNPLYGPYFSPRTLQGIEEFPLSSAAPQHLPHPMPAVLQSNTQSIVAVQKTISQQDYEALQQKVLHLESRRLAKQQEPNTGLDSRTPVGVETGLGQEQAQVCNLLGESEGHLERQQVDNGILKALKSHQQNEKDGGNQGVQVGDSKGQSQDHGLLLQPIIDQKLNAGDKNPANSQRKETAKDVRRAEDSGSLGSLSGPLEKRERVSRNKKIKIQEIQALNSNGLQGRVNDTLTSSSKGQTKGERVNFLDTLLSTPDNIKSDSSRIESRSDKRKSGELSGDQVSLSSGLKNNGNSSSFNQQQHVKTQQGVQKDYSKQSVHQPSIENLDTSNILKQPLQTSQGEQKTQGRQNYQNGEKQWSPNQQTIKPAKKLSNRYKIQDNEDLRSEPTPSSTQPLPKSQRAEKINLERGAAIPKDIQDSRGFQDSKKEGNRSQKGTSYFDQSINLDLSQKPNSTRDNQNTKPTIMQPEEGDTQSKSSVALLVREASNISRKSVDSSIQNVQQSGVALTDDNCRSKSEGLTLKEKKPGEVEQDQFEVDIMDTQRRIMQQAPRSFPILSQQNQINTQSSSDQFSEPQLSAKTDALSNQLLSSKSKLSQKFAQLFKTRKNQLKSINSTDSNQIQVEQTNRTYEDYEVEEEDEDQDTEAPNIVILNSLTHEQLMELLRAHSMASGNYPYDALNSKRSLALSNLGGDIDFNGRSLQNIGRPGQNQVSNLQMYGNFAQDNIGITTKNSVSCGGNQRSHSSTNFAPVIRNQRNIFGRSFNKEQKPENDKRMHKNIK